MINDYERDYLTVLAEAKALAGERVAIPKSGVEVMSAAVFVKLPKLDELRWKVVQLPFFSLHDYDQLGARTRALCFADSLYLMAIAPVRVSRAQLGAVARARKVLTAECAVLAAKGVIARSPTSELTFTGAHRNNASNVRALVVFMKQEWERVAPSTRLTLAELSDMERAAELVHGAYIARDERPLEVAAAQDVRLRMHTLVSHSLHAVKRAVRYLCEAEAHVYVPDAYPHHRKHKPRDKNAPVPPAPSDPDDPV